MAALPQRVSGNAKREIDDIVVTGSIGAYPLKFTRTLDTRGAGWSYFGGAGWNHNYTWSLWVRPPDEDPGNGDGFYDGPVRGIEYPSGGHFDTIVYDSPWFIDANGPHGASDKLVTCASGGCAYGSGTAYELWRADGGKVLFAPSPLPRQYRAYAIIDPYGQATTLSYNASGQLWRVTEPGGRYLEFFYQTFTYWNNSPSPGGWVSQDLLTAVTANDGRGNPPSETVTYAYEWIWQGYYYSERVPYLINASYDDGAVATYTYADANSVDPPLPDINHGHIRRVHHSCNDPRYAGPMTYIEYEYVPWTEVHDVGRGQIKSEKNILGQVVSSTTYPNLPTDPNRFTRTETRGDGPSRTFNYPFSTSSFTWTDFKTQPWTETDSYTTSLYGWTTTDPIGHTTTYYRENVLGALSKISYPATAPTGVATREFTFTDANDPCFHYGEKDENGNWTYFDRDGSNRIWQTRYPDGSTEQFTYNGFGQVQTHKLRSGGWENFRYDARGRKTLYWPPPTESDPNPEQHPTQYFLPRERSEHRSALHGDRSTNQRDGIRLQSARTSDSRPTSGLYLHPERVQPRRHPRLDGG